MKAWAGLGAGGRAVVSVAGAGIVVVAGALASGWRPGSAEAPPTPAAALVSEAPKAGGEAAAPAPGGAVQAAPEVAPVVQIAAPVLTTWAVAAGGHATIGGLGDPDAQIIVLLDGAEIASTRVTRGGEFALVTTLKPNPQPSLLSLVMVLEDGRRIPSGEVIALGPVPDVTPVADDPVAAAPDAGIAVAGGPEADVTATAAAGEGAVAAPEPQAETGAEVTVATEVPVALKVTGEGAVLLQPAPDSAEVSADAAGAAAVVPVAVQTISYGSPEIVRIGGSGQPEAFVRLYLDTKPVGPAEIPVSTGGLWQAELDDIPAGLYLLRIDQLDAAGKVTSRFETPFKRETPAALAALSSGREDSPATNDPVVVASGAQPAPATMPAEIAPLANAAPEAPVPAPAPAAEPEVPASAPLPAPTAQPEITVTVQPGHTLWAIAREEFGEGVLYVQLFDANRDRIRDPDLIYPGQVFTLPGR